MLWQPAGLNAAAAAATLAGGDRLTRRPPIGADIHHCRLLCFQSTLQTRKPPRSSLTEMWRPLGCQRGAAAAGMASLEKGDGHRGGRGG